jgi:cytochrome c peroxidase
MKIGPSLALTSARLAQAKLSRDFHLAVQARRCRSRVGRIAIALVLVTSVAALTSWSPAAAKSAPGISYIAIRAHSAPQFQAILTGDTPASIEGYIIFADPSGGFSTYQPDGATATSDNAFFSSSITSNGRTCFTCHQPQNSWEISPPEILAQFRRTGGRAALFQPIDAAVCPNAPGATAAFWDPAFVAARSQLFNRGNFRISLNAPNPLGPDDSSHITFDGTASPEWVLTVEYDPTGCELDPVYGLPSNLLSVYRRPLPSANVAFLGQYDENGNPAKFDIMWDARERNLRTQFIDATLFHGQIETPPSDDLVTQGVRFQAAMFTGQVYDNVAKDLAGGDGSGALGGPINLYNLRQSSSTPCSSASSLSGEVVCPPIKEKTTGDDGTRVNLGSDLYAAFTGPTTHNPVTEARREAIARGEAIFSTKVFNIDHVAGLNDIKRGGDPDGTERGTCSTCHSNMDVNNDQARDPKRLGIMDNSSGVTTMPWTPDFPRFAFYCPTGSIPFFSNPVSSLICPEGAVTCDKFITTDPGKGLVDGKCADLGKMKVPVLRGLAARAPYFHGGNAATLLDVVNFYDARFHVGFTDQEKQDLVAFLEAL